MTLGKNYRVFKLLTGEIVITEITETMDDGMYLLSYPAIIIPIPPQQAGGQQNQIGFGKLMPFSDYGEDVILNPASVAVDSNPHKQIAEAYENWTAQVRQMDSGIIVPNMQAPNMQAPNIPKSGARGEKIDFSKLNT